LLQPIAAADAAPTVLSESLLPDIIASKGIVAIASIFNILHRKSRIDSTSDGVCPAQCLGRIEFRSVTFAYPMRLDRPVLNKFSCVIEAGQSVALVGPSGCGKSSVIALLLRFYEPQSGTILLDGIDITTLSLQWLRSHIGYVQQEPALFDNSIHQNIEYGRVVSDASELAPDAQHSAIGSDIPSDVITAASQHSPSFPLLPRVKTAGLTPLGANSGSDPIRCVRC
jgi:ABC-type multidrug transport system fused ATPase/permease subunit